MCGSPKVPAQTKVPLARQSRIVQANSVAAKSSVQKDLNTLEWMTEGYSLISFHHTKHSCSFNAEA